MVFSSIASIVLFLAAVLGRMVLPREDRIASPITSDGRGPPSERSMRFELDTSAGSRPCPDRVIDSSSSTNPRAARTAAGHPRA